jgi:uncharacterized protein YjbJ (UPF0337 family)
VNARQDVLLTNWNKSKVLVRKRWGKITDDDLEMIDGKTDELISILRKRADMVKTSRDRDY